VFMSHGMWGLDGMFIQYYNSQIRFYLEGVGCLDAGQLELGKWTAVAATYDGAEMVVYINGRRAGSQPAAGVIEPANRSLFIGRYENESKEFQVDGWMGGVRIFPYAVPPEQAQAHYQEMITHRGVE
jgi:Concanavalin A-like lectin/glucanases superfamily